MSQAARPLQVLLLEDNPEDAQLIVRELHRSLPACQVQRVDDGDEFLAALDERLPDLVVSDHRLSAFSGMHALELVRQRAPDLPFIFVTGALDDETAVECVKAGASDYVLKDRLARLGSSIQRALELQRTREALRQSQEQLLHTQRMDALGRLAGSVAHDYNNFMTAIIGYAELLLDATEGDPRQDDVKEILHAGQRATALTRQLLAFSRKQAVEIIALQLNDVIADVEPMLRRLLGDRIVLDVACGASLPLIEADQGQLEQVIVNLAVNARDAMPAGGRLAISTSQLDPEGPAPLDFPDAEPGVHVCLSVHDTGGGIPPDVLPRIFEPFFTTKARGQGTGLGLATVYGIVRQVRGRILVRSTPATGSEFRLYFPATTLPPRPALSGAPIAGSSRAGTETILLVEDDESVRTYTARVLASHGYEVLPACDGRTARRIASERSDLSLILTDAMLPDVDGTRLAAEIAGQNGNVRVLVMSAWLDVETSGRFRFLQKPFNRDALLEIVRAVLDE